MLEIKIPGLDTLILEHIVLDYNGTIAKDGKVLPGVIEKLNALSGRISVHILTADTFGTAARECGSVNGTVTLISGSDGAREKEIFVKKLGKGCVVAVGNGMNDRLMLKAAALGILVLGPEGSSSSALSAADIVVGNINDALDLVINTKRIVATLRN